MVQPSNKRIVVEADIGAPVGVAPLDNTGKVPLTNLPAFNKNILSPEVQASLTKADAALPASQKGGVNGVAPLGPDAKIQESTLSADVVSKLNSGGNGTGGGGGSDTTKYAIGRIKAGMRTRDQKPVLFIFDGSSTTAGTNASTPANRFVNKLAVLTQNAYPQASGTTPEPLRTLEQASAARPLAAGVQFVNNGLVGTNSTDFITSANIATYAALNPSGLTVIQHMVGSSDWASGVSAATFKTNLAAKVNQIKAAFGAQQLVQVIATTYGRPDASATVPPISTWTDFMDAMKAISDADYTNVAFIDVSNTFYASGVPGADPFDLVDADNIAINDRGHDLMAELLREGYRIPLVASGGNQNSGGTPVTPTLVSTATPTISGNTAQGSLLTATRGTWNVTPTAYAYQWRSAGVNVSGATGATYNTRTDDIGKAVSVVVTATLDGYNPGTAASNSITVVAAASTAIVNTTAPAISGTAQVGSTVSATTGEWTNSPTSYGYQWKRNGSAISGATNSQYVLTTADVGSNTITVTVTAARSGYTSGTSTSSAISVTGALTGTLFTTEDFRNPATTTLAGRMTDVIYGGTPTAWGSAGNSGLASFGVDGATSLVPGGAPINASAVVNTGTTNMRVEWGMKSMAANSGAVHLEFRRTAPQYTASTYRLTLNADAGTLQLAQRASGTVPVGDPISVDVTKTHTYMAEVNGTQIRVWIDGVLVQDVADSVITAGPLAGITTTAASIYSLDTFKVWTL